MHKLRVGLFIFSAILITSCNSNVKSTPELAEREGANDKYPLIIDSLGLRAKYDDSKWNLYCIYCDDSMRLDNENGKYIYITLGELDLKFTGMRKSNDSIELNFSFYNQQVQCGLDNIILRDKYFSNGVLFVKDSLVAYTTPTTLSYFSENSNRSRFFYPLQPEVIKYLKSNWKKLHPWFRDQAQLRRVIQ